MVGLVVQLEVFIRNGRQQLEVFHSHSCAEHLKDVVMICSNGLFSDSVFNVGMDSTFSAPSVSCFDTWLVFGTIAWAHFLFWLTSCLRIFLLSSSLKRFSTLSSLKRFTSQSSLKRFFFVFLAEEVPVAVLAGEVKVLSVIPTG